MPTRLKNLEVTKVDFVDNGDNKRANVALFKRKDGEPAEPTAQEGDGHDGILKRFLAKIAKSIGISDDEVAEAMDAIKKDATTFDEKVAQRQRRKTADEIWDYCWMLQDSLCSIFWDEELTDIEKQTKMNESLTDFSTAAQAAIAKWASGTPAIITKAAQPAIAPERLEFARQTRDRLDDLIAKAEPTAPDAEPADTPADGGQTTPINTEKGATQDMKIDKSKLTPEEVSALEAIEKKAGPPDEPPAEPSTAPAEPTAKSAPAPAPATAPEEGEDIYKGLHPTVRTELERLRKQADAAEERELTDIAKKYEIIGKKPEELVPTLKSLKAAGGDAYDQMLAVLDASVAAVEKSALFSEVGKSGAGGVSDAWAQIEKHAESIQKSAPTMSWAQAVDKACEQHPDLVHEYENGR